MPRPGDVHLRLHAAVRARDQAVAAVQCHSDSAGACGARTRPVACRPNRTGRRCEQREANAHRRGDQHAIQCTHQPSPPPAPGRHRGGRRCGGGYGRFGASAARGVAAGGSPGRGGSGTPRVSRLRAEQRPLHQIRRPGRHTKTAVGGSNDRGQLVGGYTDSRGEYGFLRDTRGRITRIDVPGARSTSAAKVNDRGQIVGFYTQTGLLDDPNSPRRGYLLDRGRFVRIDFPDAFDTQTLGINNRGQIVGSAYRDPAATAGRGFLLAKGPRGAFTPINFPGAANTVVAGINNRGLIVGAYQNAAAAPGPQQDSSSPVAMPPELLRGSAR
jgi:uncharacterized membrane protein